MLPLPGMEPAIPVEPQGEAEIRELIREFRSQGFQVEDKRPQGALWVYDATGKLQSRMNVLRRRGPKFTYANKRAGWWLK